VERVKEMVEENQPLIVYWDLSVRERILKAAIRRASKWMSLNEDPKPMVGQVGGAAVHKRPVLTLNPDYVLKPLLADHRGIREIAFYESLKILSNNPTNQTYSTFLTGKQKEKSPLLKQAGEVFDTLALAFAISIQDPVVTESEKALKDAWKVVKKEVEALHRLSKFTAPYYGVIGQPGVSHAPECPFGVTDDAHLLLQDLTSNYSKPCVIDLKLGTQTFEPDAPPEKQERELGKYPEQAEFGFRIVGMRMYDPDHPDADEKGFRCFKKPYGRSLKSRDQILDALRTFLCAGVEKPVIASEDKRIAEDGVNNFLTESVRCKTIANLLVQLRQLRRWFEENKSLRFYASSLLLVYEGDTSKDNGSQDAATAKMIDFGRVRRELGGDQAYRVGLRMLNSCLGEILDQEEERLGKHR
jgi:hypothetical protein